MSIADVNPMDTTEYRVEHALHSLMQTVQEIDKLRTRNEARGVLLRSVNVSDLELSRDRLSRILEDVGG